MFRCIMSAPEYLAPNIECEAYSEGRRFLYLKDSFAITKMADGTSRIGLDHGYITVDEILFEGSLVKQDVNSGVYIVRRS